MTKTFTFGPEEFWYIKLRESDDRGESKKPAEAWGGFSTEFETNDRVYSYEQTREMDHSNFAIVGYIGDKLLVVIDADCHDVDDFDPDLLLRPTDGVPVVKSEKPGRDIPGFHFYTLLDEEVKISGAQSWIDIKADQKGHVVSPWHNDQYIIVDDQDFESFPNVIELNRGFEYDERNLVTTNASYATEYGGDIDLPDEPPEELPLCLRKALEERMKIPRDGSHPNPWIVDSITGRRLVAFGYNKSEAMGLLQEYPPQDSWDERETSYQLDQLYSKQLRPDGWDSLVSYNIVTNEEGCDCKFCGSLHEEHITVPQNELIAQQSYSESPFAGGDD